MIASCDNRENSMLRLRLLTAFFLIVFLIYAVSFAPSSYVFDIFLMAFIVIGGAEFIAIRWHGLDGHTKEQLKVPPLRKEHIGIGIGYALALPAFMLGDIVLGSQRNGGFIGLMSWANFFMIGGCAFFYRREIDLDLATQKLFNALAGFLYIAFPAVLMHKLALIEIEGAPRGIAIYFAFACVLMGDTGAYGAGYFFGDKKLLPRVSPKKTVEGAAGGLLTSAATGIFIAYLFNLPISLITAGFMAMLTGMAGQIGDLTESAIKRAANVKDSGNLLPGHGGALDRIDAILFGTPVIYLLFVYFT